MNVILKQFLPCIFFVLILGLGNDAVAQNSLSDVKFNDPIGIAVPYLNYQDISEKEVAMRQWVKENPKACEAYVRRVSEAIEALDRESLNAREQYHVKIREYECKKLLKLTHTNQ